MDLTRQVLPLFSGNWVYAPDWFFWILHAATGCDLLWDAPVQLKYRIHSESLTLLPAKAAARHAEVALAPLCALAAGSPLFRPRERNSGPSGAERSIIAGSCAPSRCAPGENSNPSGWSRGPQRSMTTRNRESPSGLRQPNTARAPGPAGSENEKPPAHSGSRSPA